jgi:hypothetical protein
MILKNVRYKIKRRKKSMKIKNALKASIFLVMLLLVLPVSVESVKAGIHIDSITGGPGLKTTVSTTTIEKNISITCSIKGGIFPFSRSKTTVDTLQIDPGNPWTLQVFFLGFGNTIKITVTATSRDSGDTAELTAGPQHIFGIFTW